MTLDASTEFALTQRIVRLYEDYVDNLDRQDLDGWAEYFVDDCKYRVISRENHDQGLAHATMYCDGLAMVRDRAKATQVVTMYEPRNLRHFLHRVRVEEVTGGAADRVIKSSASFLVIESVSDMEPYVHTVGRYLDTLVETPQGLRFKERWCVYDNYRIFNSLIFPV